jgi:hypothetical protein
MVGFFNPALSLVSMMVLPLEDIYHHSSEMLALMAQEMGGDLFHTIMCIDAVVILCGGVLTSIIGEGSFIVCAVPILAAS